MVTTTGGTDPEPMSGAVDAAIILEQPTIDDVLKDIPENVRDLPLRQWDKGVFTVELRQLKITASTVPIRDGKARPDEVDVPEGQIEEGTYAGTQLAITELYERIEQNHSSYFSAIGAEQNLPLDLPFKEKANIWMWSEDRYPPHMLDIPPKNKVSDWAIFNRLGLAETALLVSKVIPTDKWYGKVANWWLYGNGYDGASMADLEYRNKHNRKSGTDIMRGANLGDLPDWYSDARFAQLRLTGTNPMSITKAVMAETKTRKAVDWLTRFTQAAEKQGKTASNILPRLKSSAKSSFYVDDCSYFREAVGAGPTDTLRGQTKMGPKGKEKYIAADRWGCAAVTLFELHNDGILHPLAIVIDWKGSMDKSVTIFNNNRATPLAPVSTEATDWPWRFAKTCAQISDWLRHEVTVHLVNTHMVEEATIVAACRCLPDDHPVHDLLEPHWFRTLSLNAAARAVLVPEIIFNLVGLEHEQAYKFVAHAYKDFDFVENYVPNDLRKRGFPPEELESEKFKNAAYAKNMSKLWRDLRKYINGMVRNSFPDDAKVAKDGYIAAWCKEMQTKGQVPSFPTIKTVDSLVDAVTMCIHIASPQHSAINYLQNFDMAFVAAKPPALYTKPPGSLQDLLGYTEGNLMAALPANKQRDWLLSAQIPWLLSFRAAEENSLLNYANSQNRLYAEKHDEKDRAVRTASMDFYDDLRRLAIEFVQTSRNMSYGTVPYTVMLPQSLAKSILI